MMVKARFSGALALLRITVASDGNQQHVAQVVLPPAYGRHRDTVKLSPDP